MTAADNAVPLLQISKQYTQYGAAALFFVFGFKMLYEVITAVEKVSSHLAHRYLSFFQNLCTTLGLCISIVQLSALTHYAAS